MNDKARQKAFLACWLLLTLGVSAAADDHIVSELKRTYMGRTYPARTSEVWLGGDRTFVREGPVIIITRHDLKKRWLVMPGRSKYLEEPLAPSPEKKEPAKPARIQEYGFDYRPLYEWTLQETPETATLGGLSCRKIIARGEAEYASEVREIWVAAAPPIDIKGYYEKIEKPNLDERWAKIYQGNEDLRKGLVMKSRITTEPAIATTSVVEITVTKVERTKPPDGTYELPAGLRKVMTRAELYAR
ncbi:MAG: hypothetical protein ABSG19_08920 [Candidatus Aminicenantales bacterium]